MNFEHASVGDAPGGVILRYALSGAPHVSEVYLGAAMVAEALLAADLFYSGLIESSGFPVSGAPYCYELRTHMARDSVVDALAWLRKRELIREHDRPGFGPIVEFRRMPL